MSFLNDAIAKLSSVPQEAEELVSGLSEEQLSQRPESGQFSMRENVLHLRDIDVEAYEKRIRRTLSENTPLFPGVDGAKLAQERNYNAQPVRKGLDDLSRSRAASMELLRACSEDDLERKAEMQGVGVITLRKLLEFWMEHDSGHIADMKELRRSLETGTTPSFTKHQAA